jgi:hypothetical protein
MVSLQSNLLRAVAENTALVIGAMEFGAVRADAAAHPQEEFCSDQQAQSRRAGNRPKGHVSSGAKRHVTGPGFILVPEIGVSNVKWLVVQSQ